MGHHTKNVLVMVGIIVAIILVFYMLKKDEKSSYQKGTQSSPPVKEDFTSLAAGAIDNVGMLNENNYDLLQGADNEIPAHHFADLVDQGDFMKDYVTPKKDNPVVESAMERLERIQGKMLMPRTSTSVTPYNIDVASPSSAMYMVNAPRVQSLKPRNRDYSQSTFIRGDVPINYSPNVCLVAKSKYGRDALNMAGLFSPYYKSLFDKYSGKAYKNLVQHVAGGGCAGGNGNGATGGIIMDQ